MPAQRRETRSTQCAICHQAIVAGERLCAPCRSALKRARDTTVSEAILPSRRQRRRPAVASAETPPDPVATPKATSTRAWVRGAWAAALGGLLVTGGAWIVHTRGIAGTIAPRYAVAAPESGAETIKAAATATDPPAPTRADRPAGGVQAEAATARNVDARTLPSTVTEPRAVAHAQPIPLPTASTTLPAAAVEPPTPAPIVVAQAAAPRAAPPDRWQRLADALARCAAADLIARTMCQESLRLEHCEGFWGRVAACPARPERDYGN